MCEVLRGRGRATLASVTVTRATQVAASGAAAPTVCAWSDGETEAQWAGGMPRVTPGRGCTLSGSRDSGYRR